MVPGHDFHCAHKYTEGLKYGKIESAYRSTHERPLSLTIYDTAGIGKSAERRCEESQGGQESCGGHAHASHEATR